jgi:hypothetical protein
MKTQRIAGDKSDNITDITVRGNVHPRIGIVGTQGDYSYTSTLSLTSAIDWGGR